MACQKWHNMSSSVALATKTFDLNGSIHMHDLNDSSSNLQDYRRRITRAATLDTGAYIDDRGYFDGDRTIDVALNGDKALFDNLLYIHKNYGSIWIFLPDGAYTGNMQRLSQSNRRINVTLLIEAEA